MFNPFRTKAKIGIVASKWYMVYYRKWWQRRWHTVMRGHYPFIAESQKAAEILVDNIEKGKIAI